MFEYMQYNIAPWGWDIPLAFFLVGTAGMVFALAAAPNVFGGATRVLEPFQRTGMVVSLILIVAGALVHILDLGQPARFLYPIIYFPWTSSVSWGTAFLPLFGLCIVGFGYALWANKPKLLRPVGILGSLLALSMPLYTGLDLMNQQSRELWSNPTIPVLFVILSITSGTALVALILLFTNALKPEVTRLLRNILFFSVAITFALFLGQWVVLLYGSEEQQQAWRIINAEYGWRFWGLTFVIGILIPLGIVIATLARPALARNGALVTVAGVLGAVGAYTFREVLVYGGQLTQIFY
ncbi:MAG: NrfD/PsrC family molybdoenzyme membrane anchor subunit [Nitrospiraceae bacterium]